MSVAKRFTNVLKALIISYLVTGFMLLLIAFLMYKLGLDESKVNFAITLTYILASSIGGIVIGKNMKEKKYIWGLLQGALYVGIILLASMLVSHGNNVISTRGLSTVILCICGGMLGGMIS